MVERVIEQVMVLFVDLNQFLSQLWVNIMVIVLSRFFESEPWQSPVLVIFKQLLPFLIMLNPVAICRLVHQGRNNFGINRISLNEELLQNTH